MTRKNSPSQSNNKRKYGHINNKSKGGFTFMQVAIYACGAIGGIGAVIISLLVHYHKDTPLVWTTFATVVVSILGICLFWQGKVWEKQLASNPTEQLKKTTTGISVSGEGNIVRDNYVNGTETGYDIKGKNNLAERNIHIAPKK